MGEEFLKIKMSILLCALRRKWTELVGRVSEWDGNRDKRDTGEGPAHVSHLNSNPSLFCSRRE